MKGVRIGQLQENKLPKNDDYIPIGSLDGINARLSFGSIVEAVKKSMGYERVLEKCTYCGHWGAVMCACPQCGAPIDPKE